MYHDIMGIFRLEIIGYGLRLVQVDFTDALSEKGEDLQGNLVSLISYTSNFSEHSSEFVFEE